MTEIIIIMSVIFIIGVWLVASISWDIFRTLLDIKFELEDMNIELKSRKDKPWKYTMRELEAAIKHE